MSPASDPLSGAVQRHERIRHVNTLSYRADAALPFDVAGVAKLPLLLDTTVYLDRSRGKLPQAIGDLIAVRRHLVYHCGTVCAELAISIGLLDPSDRRTPTTVALVQAHLQHIETAKTVSPSATAWTEAAVLVGVLARVQGLALPKKDLTADQECCQRGRRREMLLDTLLYCTAVENDMLLVSGNVKHMDLLHQVFPSPNLLLYRPV